MLRILALMGAAVLTASAAVAAETPASPELQKAFKGTIVSTYPDGRIAKLWMKPDGSYESMGRKGERHSGRWNVKGDKVCFKRGIFGYCTAMPSESAFTTKAVTGETIQVRLAPGRAGATSG